MSPGATTTTAPPATGDFSPRFPDFIDSTMLAAFRSCPKKFYWEYIRRLRPRGSSIHLIAGGAFAKGLEVARKLYYDKQTTQETALRAGILAALKAYTLDDISPNDPKSVKNVCSALEGYLVHWPFAEDHLQPVKQSGRHWVEFSFALPLPLTHPDTGQPITYTGRCDMIAQFGGSNYTVDEKTCSQMGPRWARQFDMRGQFIGYNWAAHEHGFNVMGTVVRGVKFLAGGQEYAETIIMHNQAKVSLWYEQTLRDIDRMIASWRSGYWDYNLADSCTAYGGCHFARLDTTPTPEGYFDIYYQENTWNPLNKGSD
jgi:hypothetical protein